jgi:hypothetical protein
MGLKTFIFFVFSYKRGFYGIEIGEGKADMQHVIYLIMCIKGYLTNFVSSKNINFLPGKLRLNG